MLPNIDTIVQLIRSHGEFVLTTHVNPDGDGLGSELALARTLEKMGKHVTILNHSETPDNYKFLDKNRKIIRFVPEAHTTILQQAEVIFVVDTNQPNRLRSMEPFVLQSMAVKVVIDHHLDASDFAQHYLIDENATSTGEIIFRLLTALDGKPFEKEIADALYTAIMTDTGSFRYPRTDPETHTIVATLLQCGTDPTEIYSNVYENWTPGRLRLLGEALDSLKTEYGGKLAIMICTRKMFQQTGTSEVETDNFTTYPMSVQGVLVGILINELENGVKISFRSKGEIPINELAKEFEGGGHKNAAGARLHDVSLTDAIKSVIERAEKYL